MNIEHSKKYRENSTVPSGYCTVLKSIYSIRNLLLIIYNYFNLEAYLGVAGVLVGLYQVGRLSFSSDFWTLI
jgi:hypothetical protein